MKTISDAWLKTMIERLESRIMIEPVEDLDGFVDDKNIVLMALKELLDRRKNQVSKETSQLIVNALEFYANSDNHKQRFVPRKMDEKKIDILPPLANDGGKAAKEALEALKRG